MAELIRSLAACQQMAGRLGLAFLADLLSAVLLEAALQWDGGADALADPSMRLDTLLRLKLRLALAKAGSNVIVGPMRG